MPLRQMKQMTLDTDSSAHIGMEAQSRSSKFLLLQVWCGLLTVAMVVMATVLISMKPKPTEADVSTVKPCNASPTANPGEILKNLQGSSLSYIQLVPVNSWPNYTWVNDLRCDSCSLNLRNNSIYCSEDGHYFIYAHVTFILKSKQQDSRPLSLILEMHPSMDFMGREKKTLVEGNFPKNMIADRASLWVGRIVKLQKTDSVKLVLEEDIFTSTTFWGAYKLR